MKIAESRLSGLYFFLVFLALVIGFSLYKSFYAVVSPKYLQEVLRARLEKEVTLYELQLELVDFHFFKGIFFKPGLAWKGFHISYSKNCNYIEATSPDIYFAVDLTRLFRRRLELEEVIANQLEIKIIKDYACNEIVEEEATRQPAQTASFSETVNLRSASGAQNNELSFVKNLPDFRVAELKLHTERNLSRYLEFKNLSVLAKGNAYHYQSDLSFSKSLNVGSMPSLKLSGSFDEAHNIQITSRLREASLNLKVEPLGDKNFKTTFSVSDFPLQYVINMLRDRYPSLNQLEPLGSQWIHMRSHTVSHWNDFFEKNLILYVEDFRLSGDVIKLESKPFQFNLKDRKLVSSSTMKVDMLSVNQVLPFLFTPEIKSAVLKPGIVSGDLVLRTGLDVDFSGVWRDATVFIESYGMKKNMEVLPTKFTFESNENEIFFATDNLALRGVGGNLQMSIFENPERLTAKFSGTNIVASEIWLKIFGATIDFVDMNIDFVQEQELRWKGNASFRGFKGKQFDVERGTLQFDKNSIQQKMTIIHDRVEIKEQAYLQNWLGDIFDQKLIPNKLRQWKVTQTIDNGSDSSMQSLDFFGSSPQFQLSLKQISEDTYLVERSQPRVLRSKVSKTGSHL